MQEISMVAREVSILNKKVFGKYVYSPNETAKNNFKTTSIIDYN
jgi:hypothetical protein